LDNELRQFIGTFQDAIQASQQAGATSRRAKAARRLAANLANALASELEGDPVFLDLERRVRGIEAKLEHLAESRQDLQPLIRKAEAMLALEDIIPADALAEVRDLLKQARATAAGPRRRATPLQYDLAAECTDCNEMLVGGRRGTPRWAHVRTFVTRHDERKHEGFTAQERLDLRAASAKLEQGANEAVVKRYRIFKIQDSSGEE
jgi:hypothetical protein